MFPWLWVGGAVAVLLAAGVGFYEGDATAANRYQVKIQKMQIAAMEAAEADQQARQKAYMESSQSYEVKNAAARVFYRERAQKAEEIIAKNEVVYRDRCFDDAGLMLVNAALGGVAVAPADPAKPDAGMPRTLAPD